MNTNTETTVTLTLTQDELGILQAALSDRIAAVQNTDGPKEWRYAAINDTRDVALKVSMQAVHSLNN